jgi:hypothetical protein
MKLPTVVIASAAVHIAVVIVFIGDWRPVIDRRVVNDRRWVIRRLRIVISVSSGTIIIT